MTDIKQAKQALDICNKWVAYIEKQKDKTEALQRAAALARQGYRDEARQIQLSVDSKPVVFDGYNFEKAMPAIIEALQHYIEREQECKMKTMGLIGVLCDCSVQVDEETREQIEHAISDNLPENWRIKRTLDLIEVEFVQPAPTNNERGE